MGIALLVLAVGLVMMGVEALRPGHVWPKVAGWLPRAIALNGVQVAAVFLAGRIWNGWLLRHRPWSADGLGVVAGGLLGYLAITFVYYWWHRWRHDIPFLWRWFHQVHHSPQRIEIITSFYKHPFEIVVNSLLSSLIVYLLVGLGPGAAALAVTLSGLAELFYHWNVTTPRWTGYFFQRPESHRLHHQEGVHGFNYSDIPLWDILFGTFRNPVRWDARCGFGPRGEGRFFAMLRGIDILAAAPGEPAGPAA